MRKTPSVETGFFDTDCPKGQAGSSLTPSVETGFFLYAAIRTISRVMSLGDHLSRPPVAGRLQRPT